MDPRSSEALSGAGIPPVLGGVSPLPDPEFHFSDDWSYQYFIIVPLAQIKPYNRDVVGGMLHRIILEGLGDFDRNTFPPFLESWTNPVSACIKIVCTRKVFDKIIREARQVYLDFGGPAEMFLCYQTSGAVQ